MVFAALIEYACVTYLSKKLKMKRERAVKKEQEANEARSPVNPADPRVVTPNEYPFFPQNSSMMQVGTTSQEYIPTKF